MAAIDDHRIREEVLNVALAGLLSEQGVDAQAETILNGGKHRPDVLFPWRGLRVAIEGKIANVAKAETQVLEDARKRIRAGIAHIAVAATYPKELRTAKDASKALEEARLRYLIISEASEQDKWSEGTPEQLMGALRHAQELLAQDDIVEKTAKALNTKLVAVTRLWTGLGQEGRIKNLCDILGIRLPKEKELDKKGERKAKESRESAAKIAALVLANAFIFQEQLAESNEQVHSLRSIPEEHIVDETIDHWRYIEKHINYVPIFQLGRQILQQLPSGGHTRSAVKALCAEAIEICEKQAALRHDLMGRVYHWLVDDDNAKYLATYYTSVPTATLLLKLTMAANWQCNFGNLKTIKNFKVADIACGTGTLLMSATQALTDEYISERNEAKKSIEQRDLATLHRTLIEDTLHGYDVLPSATHLTAATLGLLAPEIKFTDMNLYNMPMEIDHGEPRLGSLDFLESSEVLTQVALDDSQAEVIRKGTSEEKKVTANMPFVDLCVMNPPFVRSGGDNKLFGSFPDDVSEKMRKELRRRNKNLSASIQAGLGSVFVALADKYLREGGRLAFVLPAALASGEAWKPTRQLIADKYHLETVILSHDANRSNFSENTALSEILFIARKLKAGEKAERTLYINLWQNPRSIHEALSFANEIERVIKRGIVDIEKSGITSIYAPSQKGEQAQVKRADLFTMTAASNGDSWLGALFAQADLLRIWLHLAKGKVQLPEQEQSIEIPMCALSTIGALGPDRSVVRNIFDEKSSDWTRYSCFWGHKSKNVRTIAQDANGRLRTKQDLPRGKERGDHLWKQASNILIAERLRMNTHRIVAVRLPEKALSNVMWELNSDALTDDMQKSLCLWFNSSFGILTYFARRAITESAWASMKKGTWTSTPVLDVRALKAKQLASLAVAYDELSERELAPIAQLNIDPTRIAIDKALCDTLNLPDIKALRELLAREPGLTGKPIGTPS